MAIFILLFALLKIIKVLTLQGKIFLIRAVFVAPLPDRLLLILEVNSLNLIVGKILY